MLITPQTLARPLTIIRHQVQSLGLKDRSLRKPELLEAIQRESPLFPTIAGWQRALVARDPLVLECMLNALTHFFLCLMPGPQAIDCRLALPTHYVHCWGARIPHLFVFLDQHEARDRPSSPKHVHQLEAMALEHEYYRPHLTRLEAWPEDVYRFARVVRAVSGLRPNIPISKLPILRTECPTVVTLHFGNQEAILEAAESSELPLANGVTIHRLLEAVKQGTPVGHRFSAFQVTEWADRHARVTMETMPHTFRTPDG
jgi:hypothetical protein